MTLPLTLRQHHPVASGVSRRSLRVTTGVIAGIALAGCGGERSAAEEASSSESIQEAQLVTYEEASGTADLAWAVLTSSGEAPQPRQGEHPFAWFMRDVELSNQRRRELGLKFWNDNPEDPRRYKWLILATHLAPYYPQDVDAWADQEAELGPNTVPVDEQALAAWDAVYPELHAEFWEADDVTDAERRYLRFGELEQRLIRMRQSAARGESVDVDPVLDEIVSYADAFPSAVSEQDQEHFKVQITTLVNLLIDNAHTLDITRRELFYRTMIDGVLQNVEGEAIAESRWSDFLTPETDAAEPFVSEAGRLWRLLPAVRWYEGRPLPGVRNAPRNLEAQIIWNQTREIIARRYRALGLGLWARYPDQDERAFWLAQTLQLRPAYMRRVVDGAYALASGERVDIDVELQSRWDADYPERRIAVWTDPEATREQRSGILFQEVRNTLIDIRSGSRDATALPDALNGVHELWTKYGLGFQSRRLAGILTRNAFDFQMTDVDLAAFLTPMLEYEDDGLRNLAEGWFRSRELRTTPLEFSAPTLDGESFDVADLRGKIVLMDYWTTTCSACIAAMPLIHEIYLEYQDKGFEVVSVSFDAERNRRKVERIEHELGLTWPTLNAEDQWAQANARFGWGNILPVYMLLDREGKVVADSADIDLGRNLRRLLDEMLAEEAAVAEQDIVGIELCSLRCLQDRCETGGVTTDPGFPSASRSTTQQEPGARPRNCRSRSP